MTFTWDEIPARVVQETAAPPVSVFVVATRAELLTPAVTTARQLTRELDARIKVLAPYVVPYPLDLSRPPVSSRFLEEQLLSQKALNADTATVQILLCRDEAEAVLGALPSESIVVIGAKKRLWRTKGDSLATRLRKAGHQVVIAAA